MFMKRNRSIVFAFIVVVIFIFSCSVRNDRIAGRVVALGMDALDLRIVRELIGQNRLPTFRRLMEKGAYGGLRSYHPLLSPMIWTTFATGRTPDVHGVLDFTSLDASGAPISVPSSRRQCPALWNIVSRFDKSCDVIGWIASWPAETIDGAIVSDRFAPSPFMEKQNLLEDTLPNLTYPENLVFTLADLRVNYSQIGYSELAPYLHLSRDECEKILSTPFSIHNRIHHLRSILSRTETYANVLFECLKKHPADLTLVYLDGTDSAAHLFMQERAPRQANVSDEDYARFSNVVNAVYERMDRLVKDVLDQLTDRDTLIIISDHGFRSGEERLRRSSLTTMGPAVSWHREEGALMAYGRGVQTGEIHDASVFDIAPTLLAMIGVAPSREMPGKIIAELVGGRQRAESFARVEDYDAGYQPPAMPSVSGADAGFNSEELQALGYAAANGKQNQSGKWENVNEYFNLGVYYENKGEYEKALQEIDRALSIDPNHRLSLGTRCRILVKTKQYEKAETDIARLETLLKDEIAAAEDDLSKIGKNDAAKTDWIRARAESGQVGLSELYHIRGEMEYQRGNYEKATASFSQSLELSSDNTQTMYNLGTCYGITGQYEKSVEILTKLLQMEPGHVKGRQSLSVAYIRLKRGASALPLLESLRSETPNDANIHYLMGEAYRTEQNMEKARECYEKALQIEPDLMKARQKLDLIIKGN